MTATLAGALIVGAALGLLGSGGSILTVPVLIYGLGLPEKTAIASSLAIVGGIALFGTALQHWRGNVVGRCMLAFGGPGLIGAAAGGTLAGFVPAALQLTVFALVLALASVSMLRPRPDRTGAAICVPLTPAVVAGGGVGVITGLIGVGGGFLLVPALLRFGHVRLPAATGSSLALITLAALAGLVGQRISGPATAMPTALVALFIAIGIVGLLAGEYGRTRLPTATLRRVFAGVLFAIAVYTLIYVAAHL